MSILAFLNGGSIKMELRVTPLKKSLTLLLLVYPPCVFDLDSRDIP